MRSRRREDTQAISAAIAANGASGKELASAESTTVQSGISTMTPITGLSITFTVGSRPVWVEGVTGYTYSGAGAVGGAIFITDGANAVKRQGGYSTDAANFGASPIARERISTPGTYTRLLQVSRAAGAATVTNGIDATTVSSLRAIEA